LDAVDGLLYLAVKILDAITHPPEPEGKKGLEVLHAGIGWMAFKTELMAGMHLHGGEDTADEPVQVFRAEKCGCTTAQMQFA
jgi:hypothetical protein